jgi:hypothetical protein
MTTDLLTIDEAAAYLTALFDVRRPAQPEDTRTGQP